MELSRELEAPHHGEALLLAADGTRRAHAPEHLSLTQSQQAQGHPGDESRGNEHEVDQGDWKSDQRGDEAGSESYGCSSHSLTAIEDFQLGDGAGGRSSEASQGQLDSSNFHGLDVSEDRKHDAAGVVAGGIMLRLQCL